MSPPALADGSHAAFADVTTAKATEYWDAIDATLDGVLGGYAEVAAPDADTSLAFAGAVLGGVEISRALDCGAGIGRVSRDVLTKLARKVDLVELIPKYVEQARLELKDEPRMGEFIVESLQVRSARGRVRATRFRRSRAAHIARRIAALRLRGAIAANRTAFPQPAATI
jgi:hypothetical protein